MPGHFQRRRPWCVFWHWWKHEDLAGFNGKLRVKALDTLLGWSWETLDWAMGRRVAHSENVGTLHFDWSLFFHLLIWEPGSKFDDLPGTNWGWKTIGRARLVNVWMVPWYELPSVIIFLRQVHRLLHWLCRWASQPAQRIVSKRALKPPSAPYV